MRFDCLPFAPLARFVGRVAVPMGRSNWWDDADPTRAVAIVSGYNVRHVRRWREQGLSLRVAENVCDALGCNPYDVWADEYRAVQPEVEDEGGTFCGRPLWYRATGRANFYGDPDPLCVQFREWMAA